MPGYADERTEPPTPRRRQESRRRGQVARSQDLTAAVPLLAGFVALAFTGHALFASLVAAIRRACDGANNETNALWPVEGAIWLEVGKPMGVFLAVVMGALVVTLLSQVGFLFTFEPLRPSLNKINPINGLQRLFSTRAMMIGVIGVGKMLVVGALAYTLLWGYADEILHALILGFPDVFLHSSSVVFRFSVALAAALVILALIDFSWQRYRHFRDLHMTKEEVKDELRSMEGDPRIKRRRREAQMQLYMQRLRREVPKADVVVTNPTHYAVAIAYDSQSMPAPRVVAKGGDWMALRIRLLAQEYGIPVVERPPLARALYDSVDVGEYIPERLYRAIAEILAFVYELTGRDPLRKRGATAA